MLDWLSYEVDLLGSCVWVAWKKQNKIPLLFSMETSEMDSLVLGTYLRIISTIVHGRIQRDHRLGIPLVRGVMTL